MTRFILIRLLQSFVALIGISILIFVLVRASGDPSDLYRTSLTSEEDIARIRHNLGLDKSWPEQYWIFITDLAQGDLGESLVKHRPVTEMILERLPNTLSLAVTSFFVSMLLALFLGVLGATKRDTFLDNGVKFVAVLGQALPGFWVAIMAILVFSVYWHKKLRLYEVQEQLKLLLTAVTVDVHLTQFIVHYLGALFKNTVYRPVYQ